MIDTTTLEQRIEIERRHEKLREMAREQGVKPITNFKVLPRDIGGEDENIDEFLDWVQQIRKSDRRQKEIK